MECRSATSVALVALAVSVCTLVLLCRAARRPVECSSSSSSNGSSSNGSSSSSNKKSERESSAPRSADTGPHYTHRVPPYTQVGLLECDAREPIPLYGRPTRRGGERWNYYAMTNNFTPQRLPVSVGGRECARLLGCTELADGETADVRGYGAARAALYTRDDRF